MENFDWTKFTRRIAIKSDLATIYKAWANPIEIEKWFLCSAEYLDNNKNPMPRESMIQKGYSYAWSWYLYDIIDKNEILEANGKDKIKFKFAGETIVEVTLKEQKDHIMVELIQYEIPMDDKSKRDIRLGCDSGWSFFMVNLKSYYEFGNDLRCKDPDFKPSINT